MRSNGLGQQWVPAHSKEQMVFLLGLESSPILRGERNQFGAPLPSCETECLVRTYRGVSGDTQDEAEHFAVGTAQAETLSVNAKMEG